MLNNLKGYFHQSGLWPRMAVAISVGFLALFAAFLALGERALQESASRLLDQRLVIAQMAAGQLDTVFQQAISELQRAHQFLPQSADGAIDTGELESLTRAYSELGLFEAGVAFINPNGVVLSDYPPDLHPPQADLSTLPHIRQAIRQQEVALSVPFREPLNGQPVVAVVVPVFHQGQFLGVMSGLLRFDAANILTPLQQATQFDETGHAALVDEHGRVLASTFDLPFLSWGEHVTFYRQAAQGGRPQVETVPFERTGVMNEPEGHQHVMAYAPLKMAPWGVAVGGDVIQETFASVWRLRIGLSLLGIAVLAAVWGGTLFGARRLVRPVQQLTRSAGQIAAGNLQTPLHVSEGGEIGELAAALEAMRCQLLANINRLASENQNLENQVAEQIEELSQQQTVLTRLDQTIRQSLDLPNLLDRILTQTCLAGRVAQGVIFLHDDESGQLKPAAVHRVQPAALAGIVETARQAMTNRQTTLMPQTASAAESAGPDASDPARVLAIPMLFGQTMQGVFVLIDNQAAVFSERQTILLSTIASQTALLIQNHRYFSSLKKQAILEERSRLAREIHDSVVQVLGFVKLQLERMSSWMTPPTPDLPRLQSETANLIDVLEDAYAEARDAIIGLRVGSDENETLDVTLTEYVQTFSARYRLPVDVRVEGEPYPLEATAVLQLLRVAQEGLTNVRKHAQANYAQIVLRYTPHKFTLLVIDDGRGLPPQLDPNRPSRGMQFMQERVDSLNGSFAVRPRIPRGTELEVTLEWPTPAVEVPALPEMNLSTEQG